jgi:hypothetical protein
MNRTFATVAAVALSAAVLVACGGGDNTQTVTETISEETTRTVEGASSGELVAPVDGSATSGGIEVTVNRAFTKPTVSYIGGTEDSGVTPDAEPRTVRAPQGGSYVYVVAEVLNETTEGIDLTCEYPMKVKLRDTDHKRYDPIEGLYLVSGNPDCEKLQPGFEGGMTWIFLVPPSADVEALEFSDVTNFNKEPPAAAIALSTTP